MAEMGKMETLADLLAYLDALRASGAAERDPVRFAYLAALARRCARQPATIRRLLLARIGAAAGEVARQASSLAPAPVSAASPLAELLAYIAQQAHVAPDTLQPATEEIRLAEECRGEGGNTPQVGAGQGAELKSVAYFRSEWSKLSTEQQLTQTLAQAPENAGPMNSQHLVLRSLQVMHDIAPEYLQGFMSYIDTLIWLEHADPAKPAGRRSSGGEAEKKTAAGKRRTARR